MKLNLKWCFQYQTHIHTAHRTMDGLMNGKNIDPSIWFIFPSWFSLKNYPFVHEMDNVSFFFFTFTCISNKTDFSSNSKRENIWNICVLSCVDYIRSKWKNWNECFLLFSIQFSCNFIITFYFLYVHRCYNRKKLK